MTLLKKLSTNTLLNPEYWEIFHFILKKKWYLWKLLAYIVIFAWTGSSTEMTSVSVFTFMFCTSDVTCSCCIWKWQYCSVCFGLCIFSDNDKMWKRQRRAMRKRAEQNRESGYQQFIPVCHLTLPTKIWNYELGQKKILLFPVACQIKIG